MKDVDYNFSQRAMGILCLTPKQEKGSPKPLKRLIRIRRNFFRELYALNKELKRHKAIEIGNK